MRIDTERIKQQTDLLALIGSDFKKVAGTNGGEFAGPCPFCGGRDRFRVQPNATGGGRWFCRSCTDPWRDAIAYIQKRDNLGFREACERLAGPGQLPTTNTLTPPAPRPPDVGSDPPPAEWQATAGEVVAEAHERLMSGAVWIDDHPFTVDEPAGYWRTAPAEARAFHWLQSKRGLTRATIKAARLGFNPEWREVLPGHWLAPGVVIPCYAAGALWYVQVRTFKKKLDKYLSLKGSTLTALYGADSFANAHYGVIVEGEFDALLLAQHAGDLVAVGTMGSAGSIPRRWQLALAHLQGLFVALDKDKAGEKGAANWRDLAQPMPTGPGAGQDVTDYYQSGGDLRRWVLAALAATDEGQRLAELEGAILETPAAQPEWGAMVAEYGRHYKRLNRAAWDSTGR